MNSDHPRRRSKPLSPPKRSAFVQTLAAKGFGTVERTVSEFVAALPVLDMAFLLIVLAYVKTS
jgi:hypothetical protein